MSDVRDRTDLWTSVLDDLERVIDAQALYLDDATDSALDEIPVFEPPAELPPLPAELGPRAVALAERSASLLASAHTATERTRPIDPPRRPHRAQTGTSSTMFDERA